MALATKYILLFPEYNFFSKTQFHAAESGAWDICPDKHACIHHSQ